MDKKIFNNQFTRYIYIFLDSEKKLHFLERIDVFKAKSLIYDLRLQKIMSRKIQNNMKECEETPHVFPLKN